MLFKQFTRGARGRGRGRGVGGHRQGPRGNRRFSPGMMPDMSGLSLTDVCATTVRLHATLAVAWSPTRSVWTAYAAQSFASISSHPQQAALCQQLGNSVRAKCVLSHHYEPCVSSFAGNVYIREIAAWSQPPGPVRGS